MCLIGAGEKEADIKGGQVGFIRGVGSRGRREERTETEGMKKKTGCGDYCLEKVCVFDQSKCAGGIFLTKRTGARPHEQINTHRDRHETKTRGRNGRKEEEKNSSVDCLPSKKKNSPRFNPKVSPNRFKTPVSGKWGGNPAPTTKTLPPNPGKPTTQRKKQERGGDSTLKSRPCKNTSTVILGDWRGS